MALVPFTQRHSKKHYQQTKNLPALDLICPRLLNWDLLRVQTEEDSHLLTWPFFPLHLEPWVSLSP